MTAATGKPHHFFNRGLTAAAKPRVMTALFQRGCEMRKFLVLLFLLAGCTPKPQAESIIESIYKPSAQPVGSVIVIATNASIGEREILENTLVEEFTSRGISALRSLDHLPITFTPEQAAQILKEAGTEGILVFGFHERGEITGPLVTMAITPTLSAGKVLTSPTANFVIDLYHSQQDAVVWRGAASASGNRQADYKTLAEEVARKAVAKLAEDGLLEPTNKTSP